MTKSSNKHHLGGGEKEVIASSGFRMLTDEWHVCVPACSESDSRLCFEGEQNQVRDWSTARDVVHLDRGLNGIVVPRGLFMQSKFFKSLNTTTWSYSNPLLGSMVMGNDNFRELNSRVLQMLIAANLTLAEAWTSNPLPTMRLDSGLLC